MKLISSLLLTLSLSCLLSYAQGNDAAPEDKRMTQNPDCVALLEKGRASCRKSAKKALLAYDKVTRENLEILEKQIMEHLEELRKELLAQAKIEHAKFYEMNEIHRHGRTSQSSSEDAANRLNDHKSKIREFFENEAGDEVGNSVFYKRFCAKRWLNSSAGLKQLFDDAIERQNILKARRDTDLTPLRLAYVQGLEERAAALEKEGREDAASLLSTEANFTKASAARFHSVVLSPVSAKSFEELLIGEWLSEDGKVTLRFEADLTMHRSEPETSDPWQFHVTEKHFNFITEKYAHYFFYDPKFPDRLHNVLNLQGGAVIAKGWYNRQLPKEQKDAVPN